MITIATLRGTSEQHALLKRMAKDAALSMNDFLLARAGLVPGICRVCACTEEHGCPEGCSWADGSQTLCSICAESLEERDQWPILGMTLKNAPEEEANDGS